MCKSFVPRSRQITTPVPYHLFFTGRMPLLPRNQQHQSTEGKKHMKKRLIISATVSILKVIKRHP